jgi:hypothetical protein
MSAIKDSRHRADHRRRSPCCGDEARRYLAAEGANSDPLARAAAFMLNLVDVVYGTDNYSADEEGLPSEAEFRRYAAVIHGHIK